ncbi:MAG: site-2 protease family protein [Acidobacteriia bacterium]|nr:site-2 protease family protein [Terriglobia bacterium]
MVVYVSAGRNAAEVLAGVGFILAVFVCVVLHEFGHSLTARRYGIGTRNIILLPIGGVSRLERVPEKPSEEFIVAVMGPVVSIGISCVIFVLLALTGSLGGIKQMLSWNSSSFLQRLMVVNFTLAVFNLLPAFPMDGGRILRSLLAIRLGRLKATRIAAFAGKVMALIFGAVGVLSNPFLLIIAIFVWMGAAQEASAEEMKSTLEGIPVGRIAMTDFVSISPSDPLSRVVELILHGTQQDFPVIEDGRLVGMVARNDVVAGLAKSGPAAPVTEVMRRDFPVISEPEMLPAAVERLESSSFRALPILQNGRLAGLLTLENLVEFLMIQAALSRPRANH